MKFLFIKKPTDLFPGFVNRNVLFAFVCKNKFINHHTVDALKISGYYYSFVLFDAVHSNYGDLSNSISNLGLVKAAAKRIYFSFQTF